MDHEQYVCRVCGYNMIGYMREQCPFCGASQMEFLSWEECARSHKVQESPVKDGVTRMTVVPRIGYDHAAYRIDIGDRSIWIDCPSSFNDGLRRSDLILFTHHHFMGAVNLYRHQFGCPAWIHRLDSSHQLCQKFVFDDLFETPFVESEIEAFPINGHTPGFTAYISGGLLFICDYFFYDGREMRINFFGAEEKSRQGASRVAELLEGRAIEKVCGFNYVADYEPWMEGLKRLLGRTPARTS